MGPKWLAWGTPECTLIILDMTILNLTSWVLCVEFVHFTEETLKSVICAIEVYD